MSNMEVSGGIWPKIGQYAHLDVLNQRVEVAGHEIAAPWSDLDETGESESRGFSSPGRPAEGVWPQTVHRFACNPMGSSGGASNEGSSRRGRS